MADHAKSRREGDRVYFVINRHITPTNVCVLSCAFCGFARKPGEAGAYEHTIEDMVAMVKDETREVHIVGGHHPDWPFEYYERMIQAIRAARPDVQIKALTASQVAATKLVARQTPPADSLKTIAVSRLLLDNFPHVEAYWVTLGEETTSVALHFGADDVNGTLEDERIQHLSGAQTPAGVAREQLFRMIRDAGKIPVERDALYNVVKIWP